MLKLALITAIRKDNALLIESTLKRIMVNLGPMYLAGYIQKKGLPVEIQIGDRLEDFKDFKPDILGISCVTENFEFAKLLADQARALWNPIIVLGGVHITALPESFTSNFDFGVIGEGEEVLCDLLQIVIQGKRRELDCLKKMSGLIFLDEGKLFNTGFRKGIDSLDEIPHPARHKYVQSMGMTYMMTSRGCPYTCSFCTIPATSEGYRMHSPEYVVQEIQSIKKHYPQVNHIRIFDDLYIVNRKRVLAVADLIAAEGLNKDLSFTCWGRANLIDDEILKAFKKMNMSHVAFGAESGSSRVLSKIKPGSSVEENQKAIDLLHENGTSTAFSVILGHPLETEDDLWATYEFIEKNLEKIHDVEFNVAIPWPGTELWQIALAKGLVHPRMNFNSLRETAFFPNYSTDLYPYINDKISPERFDVILAEFKKLFWELFKRNNQTVNKTYYLPNNDIARLY